MRSLFYLLGIIMLVASPRALHADDLAGPLMGYLPDGSGHGIRPVRGLPGSALMGDPIRFPDEVRKVSVSPSHDAAVLWTEASVSLATLSVDADPARSAIALPEGARISLAAFSPGGSNLILYDGTARAGYLLPLRRGSPGDPRTLDLSMAESAISMIAVSDGDDPLIAGIRETGSVFVVDLAANYRAIADFQRPTSLAFLGTTRDLAIADSGAHSVARLTNPLAGGAPEALTIDGLGDGVQIVSSSDGKTLLVLDGSRTVRWFDTSAGTAASVECECTPAAGQTLRGRSLFRVTESVDQPVWILDAGSNDPRLLFVPAAPSEAAAQ